MKNALACFAAALLTPLIAAAAEQQSAHDFTVPDIGGKPVELSGYAGSPVLIVNVASKCGLTPQYAELVALQTKFMASGFKVLGFPANNFGGQEPGTDDEIFAFCSSKYDVNFPMFSKLSVKGDDAAPLFAYLTTADNPDFTGDIKWNFEKILVGKDGKVLRRFPSATSPTSDEIVAAVTVALAAQP